MRNGLGESLLALNRIYGKFEDIEHNDLYEVYTIVLFLGIISMVILILCLIVIIIPTVVKIEKAYANVWQFFYLLPRDVI